MMRRPDIAGLLSRNTWPRAAIRTLALAAGLAASAPIFAQVSPGPLARAHAQLEGTLKCFQCHGTAKEAMDGKCLACHDDIAWLRDRARGVHARTGRAACATCHPDHAGASFALIQWEEGKPESFDHARAGWPLAGNHASIACEKCHTARFQVSPAAKLGRHADDVGRWTGLEPACGSCHADIHKGALGDGCATCHGTEAWKPVSGFDHAKTGYALTGRHAPLECGKCHQREGPARPVYKPLPHRECAPCHSDPHAGRFGPACSVCHVTDDFRRIQQKGFNHDLTRYPLRGRHAALACAQCHDARAAWGRKPAFGSCGACHEDAHAGQATLAGRKVDCASCHSVAGWKPSTFSAAMHASARYPLEARHREVACGSCHLKRPPGVAPALLGTSGVLMRARHDRCADCHADAHGGQLARRADRGACESCHKVTGWTPSTFGVVEHASAKLVLSGRHAKVPCAACHGPDRRLLSPLPGPAVVGKAGVAFALKEDDCASCHADPHDGRFEPSGLRPKKSGCLACHDFNAFAPSTVSVATHATFGYALDGAHRAVACDACHADLKAPPARSSLRLAAARGPSMPLAVKDQRCEGCHQGPHGDQFAGRSDRGACASCHDDGSFSPAGGFDHARDATFRLDGAHARLPCARCHQARQAAGGRTMVVYRPVPKDCKSCHSGRRPGTLAVRPEGKEGGSS